MLRSNLSAGMVVSGKGGVMGLRPPILDNLLFCETILHGL